MTKMTCPRWQGQSESGVPEACTLRLQELIGGDMMRKFSWVLLVLLAFSVYAEDEKAVVIRSAEE